MWVHLAQSQHDLVLLHPFIHTLQTKKKTSSCSALQVFEWSELKRNSTKGHDPRNTKQAQIITGEEGDKRGTGMGNLNCSH